MIKELYNSIFVLFFRLGAGQWPKEMNADVHKGVAGVSVLEIMLLMSAFSWIQIFLGQQLQLNPLLLGTAVFALYTFNYYLLHLSGGIAFEKQFSHLKKERRIALLSWAVVVILMAIVILSFSVVRFRSAFTS
jgi:hypothetical protein